MTNRLSKENVQHNLDAGHQNLPWSVSEPSGFLAGIDFNAILDNPQAKEIIQSLPVQPLYYGLKKKGLAECLQIILTVPEPHLDLSVTDSRGRNIAQIAVEKNRDSQRCLELLSGDRRVDWNIKNPDGETPVMYCLKNNKIEMARCLINTPGVDLDTVDRDGKHLETIARERDLNILSLVCRANTTNIASRIPECPVCYERFTGQSQVFQCQQGHFVCGTCRPRVQTCPVCRGIMMGRCNGFEQFLQSLNN